MLSIFTLLGRNNYNIYFFKINISIHAKYGLFSFHCKFDVNQRKKMNFFKLL